MSDLDAIKRRIRQLREMTVDRGCTEAEAMAAAEIIAKLMRQYRLTEGDVVMEAETSPHAGARPGVRGFMWNTIARCTNTAVILAVAGVEFVGQAPGPEIAVYLKEVCDRAIDGALAEFRGSAFYKSRRKASTKRRATDDFTRAMVRRICHRLAELYADLFDESQVLLAKAHLDALHPATKTLTIKNRGGSHYAEAAAQGWRAGGAFGLHHGMGGGASAKALPKQ